MLKGRSQLVILILVLFSISISAQETFVHEDAGVSITLPAGWYYESDENSLIVYSEDETVAMSFSILNSTNLDNSLTEVDDMLKSEYDSIELGEAEEMEVNGLNAIWIDGTADELEMAFLIVDSPYEEVILFVSAWGNPESIENHMEEVKMIFNNIAPVNE